MTCCMDKVGAERDETCTTQSGDGHQRLVWVSLGSLSRQWSAFIVLSMSVLVVMLG